MPYFPFNEILPTVASDVFVAPTAQIIGDVEIGEQSSIWFSTVLRGDVNIIRVGSQTNIQDLTMVHVESGGHATYIGDQVTIGHKAIVHGCKIGNRCLIGMGAILMDGVEIGDDCLVAAGALVTQGKKIPAGSVVMGSPGKVVREVSDQERQWFKGSALHYHELSLKYQRS